MPRSSSTSPSASSVARTRKVDPFEDRVVRALGGLVFGRLNVDRAPGEGAVLAAMVEMQMGVGQRDDVVGRDPTVVEQVREVTDDRPVGGFDLGVPEADPRVEQQHAIGVDDRIRHDDAQPARERAPIRVDEIRNVESFDPDGGKAGESSHAAIVSTRRPCCPRRGCRASGNETPSIRMRLKYTRS